MAGMAGVSGGIAVWLEPGQAEFVRAAADHGRFSIAAAGSPVKGQSGHVAAHLGCEPFDDLRSALVEGDCPLVWLAAAGEFGGGTDDLDARAVLAATARGVRVVTSEPIPSSALNLAPAGWSSPGGGEAGARLRFACLPRLSRPFMEGQEVLSAFGPPRLVQIEAWSSPAEGTLGARLVGAVDLLVSLMGEPESIDAALVGPAKPGAGGTLRDLHGDLSAMMRMSDGRSAVVTASNAAGRWGCVVTLISAEGRLRFYDDGFEWVGPGGARRDELRLGRRTRGSTSLAQAGAVVAGESIATLLDPGAPDPGPLALEQVLTISQAALLSARTGNPESPESIRRMMLVP
jgi:hypothetical protein